MTEHDKENVGNIISGEGSWFTAKLFRLISTADTKNRAKLYGPFPEEVNVVHKYQTGKEYNFPVITDENAHDLELVDMIIENKRRHDMEGERLWKR